MVVRFLLISLSLLGSRLAFSYPNFIGKGYHTCLTCHYNPFGNGPLNDYGRGVSATGLAGNQVISKSVSDESLSKRSGFFFYIPKQKWFRPSLDYRGATLRRGLQSDNLQESWINMQIDANLTSEFGPNNMFVLSYTHSVVPSNSVTGTQNFSSAKPGEDLTFSREHYLGVRLSKSTGIYLGKMDKVFGIRVPDHTAYSRAKTGINQYGATHGVVLHYGKESFDWGVQSYVGDLEKEKNVRLSGASTKFEYSISEETRVGVSALSEKSDSLERLAYSFLTKMRVGKSSSLMFELGRVVETPESSDPTTQQYIFLQNHFYLTKGLYFLTTYEQSIPNTAAEAENHRIAPGLQYFPMQRVELRADLINSKSYTPTNVSKDSWEFLGQIHLWF